MSLQKSIEERPEIIEFLSSGGCGTETTRVQFKDQHIEKYTGVLSSYIKIHYGDFLYHMEFGRRYTAKVPNHKVFKLRQIVCCEYFTGNVICKYSYDLIDDDHSVFVDEIEYPIEDENDIFNLSVLDVGDNIFDLLYLSKYNTLLNYNV